MRLILFIDGQNMYRGARRAFFADADPHMNGQFAPDKLGELVASRGGPTGPRVIAQVRI